MNPFDLSGYNLQAKISWVLLLLLSAAVVGFGLFSAFSFSQPQMVVLAVAILISSLGSQYQPKITRFKTYLSAKEIIVFWGVVWLGAVGGIFLSVAGEVAGYRTASKDKKRWAASAFSSVISTFVASQVFYLFLNNVGGFSGDVVARTDIQIQTLAAGIMILASVHYALRLLLYSVFLAFVGEYPFFTALKVNSILLSASYLVGLLGVFGVYFAFLRFGLLIGLVVLPVVIAAHLSYRIHFQSLALKTRELSESNRMHLATVEALATAIDARDQVGVGHVRRTQIYAVGLGEILGLSSDEIKALRTGALLHDIGKLGVPDHILNKPGRLTQAEMEKMKIHSTVGASILAKVKFPYPVIPTVRYHHERWDGAGYPEGLKKEEIPLTARILALSDSYDTLRGARPYRGVVSRDEARRSILHGSGTQFDPKLVDVFLRNLKHFEMEVNSAGLAYEFDNLGTNLLSGKDAPNDSNQGYVEQIKRANREVFALYELARVFSSSLNLQDTLSLFVQKVGELMPFDTCVVYLMDKTEEFATATYADGINAESLTGRKIKPGDGATGYVLQKRQAVYNINPALDFSFSQLDSIQDYTAMASLPLIANELLIGAISIYSCELENYEDEHMRLLETLSRMASDAISKSLYHAEAETNALTDPMTHLPNARSLQIQFENEAARSKRSGSGFQLIMLDLDGFKAVNDTFGHKAGDLFLKEISKVMRGQLREYDFLARYAGDEFVAIVPETSAEEIQDLCQRMEKAILNFRLPVENGRFAQVGASIGSACFPQNGETIDQIIIAADQMMYSVKAAHRQKALASPPSVPALENIQLTEESFVLELDESHIVSNAVN